MPGENREQLARGEGRGGGGNGPGGRREFARGGDAEPDPRNRGSTATMIPLPRTGQFASASQNQKVAKTEKNRLKLIMESRGTAAADFVEKERRIGMREDRDETTRDNWFASANSSTVPRFSEESRNSHRDEKVIKLNMKGVSSISGTCINWVVAIENVKRQLYR